MMKPMLPVTPICIEVTAPRRPAIIPSGRPKFSPQPDCIIGTIASTRMPFIPTERYYYSRPAGVFNKLL